MIISALILCLMSERLVFSVKDGGNRLESLDLLRGASILLMVAVNSLADYVSVPVWLKHAPGNGFTVADAVAPMFLFALGFGYGLSFRRRLEKDGPVKTITHFLLRGVILFCMGFFGEMLAHHRVGWGVLTMIGAASVFSLWFMFLKPLPRLIAGVLVFAAYQAALLLGMPVLFYEDGLGGPAATAAFGFIVVVASCAADFLSGKGRNQAARTFGGSGLFLVPAALVLSIHLPINKHIVSASYILLTAGISALVMCAFYLVADIGRVKIPLIGRIGRNALVLYIIHHLFIFLLNIIVPLDAALYAVVPGAILVLSVCGSVGMFLDLKGWRVRL